MRHLLDVRRCSHLQHARRGVEPQGLHLHAQAPQELSAAAARTRKAVAPALFLAAAGVDGPLPVPGPSPAAGGAQSCGISRRLPGGGPMRFGAASPFERQSPLRISRARSPPFRRSNRRSMEAWRNPPGPRSPPTRAWWSQGARWPAPPPAANASGRPPTLTVQVEAALSKSGAQGSVGGAQGSRECRILFRSFYRWLRRGP